MALIATTTSQVLKGLMWKAAIEREQTHSIQPQSDAESDAGKRETLAVPACIRVALLNGPRQGEDNLFGFIQAGPPAVLRAHLLGARGAPRASPRCAAHRSSADPSSRPARPHARHPSSTQPASPA